MRPYTDPQTGNFLAVYMLLLNDRNEVLVEVGPRGAFAFPGGIVTEEDHKKNKGKFDETLLNKVTELLEIAPQEHKHFCTIPYTEDLKHFDCMYFVCKHWNGDVGTTTSAQHGLLWVHQRFARNLLTSVVDKQALANLDP